MTKSIEDFSRALATAKLRLERLGGGRALREAAGMTGEIPKQVVRPGTVEELAVILPAAKAAGVALWTVWNASGNALVISPGEGTRVLLDLSKLDRILSVDAESGFALVEPGVSHRQLAEHLRKKGLKFWLDSGLDADASIAGGIWQRRFGYTAYGDTLMMQCGMEIMLRDGSLVRTGMGAMPGQNSWQLFKYGFGPYADGTFTQTSHAVITKMGFWISPEPPAYRPFAWRIEDDASFIKVMEAVRDLRINMIVPNTIVAIDGVSESALTGLARPAAWNVYGALYGLPKNVDAVWGMLGGMTPQLGAVRLEPLGEDDPRAQLMSGRTPATLQQRMVASDSNRLHLVFALPIEGEAALDFARRSAQLSEGSGCSLIIEQGTSWRALLAQVFIGFKEGSAAAGVALGQRLTSEWAATGIGVVQASPALYPTAQATYSDEGFATLRERIGAALA